MSQALKQDDILELSKLYESEFNKPDLHDRVLIFDVTASCRFSGATTEENVSDENEEIENDSSEEESDGEATKTEKVKMCVKATDASHDCEIAANG